MQQAFTPSVFWAFEVVAESDGRVLVDATEQLTGVELADLVCGRPKQGFTLPITRWSQA